MFNVKRSNIPSMYFCYVYTHVGVDVVPVRDSIDIHAFLLIAKRNGMVPHVVHWIRFLGLSSLSLMPSRKKTTLILIMALSYISCSHYLSHIFFCGYIYVCVLTRSVSSLRSYPDSLMNPLGFVNHLSRSIGTFYPSGFVIRSSSAYCRCLFHNPFVLHFFITVLRKGLPVKGQLLTCTYLAS